MPDGHVIKKPEDLSQSRWKPVNELKNSPVTLELHVSGSDKRYTIPETAPSGEAGSGGYWDDVDDVLLGSTTLSEMVKRVKAKMPELYLWDQVGGQTLTCGPHEFMKDDWETTMVCQLVREDAKTGKPPAIELDDGRTAFVVTIGQKEAIHPSCIKSSVVHRCMSKVDGQID